MYKLEKITEPPDGICVQRVIESHDFKREKWLIADGSEIIKDSFIPTGIACCFLRLSQSTEGSVRFGFAGNYSLSSCRSGGWLVTSFSQEQPAYWIPQNICLRSLDANKHILTQAVAGTAGFNISDSNVTVECSIPKNLSLDLVFWKIPAEASKIVSELEQPAALETQPFFMFGSSAFQPSMAYQKPAGLYAHLVHGHVYENHAIWPRYWRICSEFDAYALYLTLSGLESATHKRIYSLMKEQILFSVIARQSGDGGWYHGEWTDRMESHSRFHCAAMHLLTQALEEQSDDIVRKALEKAASFISKQTDKIKAGTWFLHDSLESSPETQRLNPFRWVKSRALGKSPANMLVLNTHLDTMIALKRYEQVTGDKQYETMVSSACDATKAVINLRPAEWLYRPLFWAIGLTLLPTSAAKKLPLPMRAIKRLAWKCFIPWLYQIKRVFPRLVMPGGYIDRALSLKGLADDYHSMNVMDLIRCKRQFPGKDFNKVIDKALEFTQKHGIRAHWAGTKGKEYALGFWAEALYHMCMLSDDQKYRNWLAEAIIDLTANGLGLPPSLLGANAEAVPVKEQLPYPLLEDSGLRIANLSREGHIEIIVVNTTGAVLSFKGEIIQPYSWIIKT